MNSLLNKSNVRKLALEHSAAHRAGKFNRVSKEFIEAVEANTRAFIAARVHSHPSIGKTLK